VLFAISFSIHSQSEEKHILQLYTQWKQLVKNPKKYTDVFAFFSAHPNWPSLQMIQTAEKSIDIHNAQHYDQLLKWFRAHPPTTAHGTLAFAYALVSVRSPIANTYVNQTWIYQNLSPEFAIKFRKMFKSQIPLISDAKRIKKLKEQKKYEQLENMLKIVPAYMANHIFSYLAKLTGQQSAVKFKDKLSTVKSLTKAGKYTRAAQILIQNNNGEHSNPNGFFDVRRDIACNMAKKGHALQAYKVISLHCLSKLIPAERKNYVKAEWYAGFMAFRFLDDHKNGLKHFQNAYSASTDAMHKSKNAFWVAEVCYAMDDTIQAFEWYQKACEHFNTFYGRMAASRLSKISYKRFVRNANANVIFWKNVPKHIEKRFSSRELVKVLKTLSKLNYERNAKYLMPFYQKLSDEINDAEEEKLLMNIATSKAEMEIISKILEWKQKYSNDRRTFKLLPKKELDYIKKINTDPCFISFVHSIIKRESFFNPRAKSHVGAVGLMQIMPTTADFELKKIRFYTGRGVSLFDVEKNIIIGSFLLNRLMKKYKNNLVYVMYAYNAGEGNAAKFIKSIKKLINLTNIDITELIPIKETRLYVKRVMHDMMVYQEILNANNCYYCESISFISN
jgi:soluble lytic murein transglycosylase